MSQVAAAASEMLRKDFYLQMWLFRATRLVMLSTEIVQSLHLKTDVFSAAFLFVHGSVCRTSAPTLDGPNAYHPGAGGIERDDGLGNPHGINA